MSRTGAGATRAFRDPNQNQDVKGKCQMDRKKACVAFIVLLTCALAGQALAQGQEIEFKSNADDLKKFRNIEIRQDGDLGLVTFNYDFVISDKVHHSGLEVWQLCKIDGQWKILSVTWTIY